MSPRSPGEPTAPLSLDAETIDALGERIAEALATRTALRGRLVDAKEIAQQFGLSASWVRDNARWLGAHRLGQGPRPRLRFDPVVVAERLRSRSGDEPVPEGQSPTRRGRARDDGARLLEIRPRGPSSTRNST